MARLIFKTGPCLPKEFSKNEKFSKYTVKKGLISHKFISYSKIKIKTPNLIL